MAEPRVEFAVRFLALLLVAAPVLARAQFVYPKEEYHNAKPGLYKEDPFITKYRQEFFAVFTGDIPRFEKAYSDIKKMVEANPKDARAMVWLGNGDTIEAGVDRLKGKKAESLALLDTSRKHLNEAVALTPEDPNIYMMRAATIYVQGQYFPSNVPRSNWELLRDDCLKFIKYIGPVKMKGVSIHLRGEAYGELGIAYLKLGDKANAKKAFEAVRDMNPNTDYSKRAEEEIKKLG